MYWELGDMYMSCFMQLAGNGRGMLISRGGNEI